MNTSCYETAWQKTSHQRDKYSTAKPMFLLVGSAPATCQGYWGCKLFYIQRSTRQTALIEEYGTRALLTLACCSICRNEGNPFTDISFQGRNSSDVRDPHC